MTKDQRNDLLDHSTQVVFSALKMISKREQKTVRPGVIVIVKWLDAMPTTEMLLDIRSDTGRFEPEATVELYDLKTKRVHTNACCDQIVHVIGKLL